MEPEPDHSDFHSLLSPVVKLLIMAASLALASFIGFYLHPHLPPLVSNSLPQIWHAAQGWLTAPVLFLLLNLVVGTLYFRFSKLSWRPESPPQNPPHTRTSPAPIPSSTASTDVDGAPVANASRSTGGLRARIEKSRPFARLVRSKSEQIPPSVLKAEASGSRLKKAGTFEAATQSPRKPIVIVADPPEDESSAAAPGNEEVDKKAEDFISRFYQKVKLQRLDSYLRNQQILQQG